MKQRYFQVRVFGTMCVPQILKYLVLLQEGADFSRREIDRADDLFCKLNTI